MARSTRIAYNADRSQPSRASDWPKAAEPKSDTIRTYTGEPYLGPWG